MSAAEHRRRGEQLLANALVYDAIAENPTSTSREILQCRYQAKCARRWADEHFVAARETQATT